MVVQYAVNIICCVAVVLGILISKYWEQYIKIKDTLVYTKVKYFLFFVIFLVNCITTYIYTNNIINYSLIHVHDYLENITLCLGIIIIVICVTIIDIIEVDNIFKIEQPWSTDPFLYKVRLGLVFIMISLTICLYVLIQVLYSV